MKRGFEAVLVNIDSITSQAPGDAIRAMGKTLVMTIGGASGPLYGSFFMAFGEAITKGTAFSVAAYDRTSQRISNVQAARDAETRNAKVIADAIRTRIAAALASRG